MTIQFFASRHDFSAALTTLCNVVETKSTVPILRNVKVLASGDKVTLAVTDLDVDFMAEMPALKVEGGLFSATVDAKLLDSILRKSDADEVGFRIVPVDDEHDVLLFWGETEFTLKALPMIDFPEMTVPEFSHEFIVSSGEFYEMLDGVESSISTEETRYYLNGTYMHAIGGELRAVTTDGHRLSLMNMGKVDGVDGMPGVIIPRKVEGILRKIFKGKKPPEDIIVEIAGDALQARLTFGRFVMLSKMIDGTFPDYQRALPTDCKFEASFSSAAAIKAVDIVALMDKGGVKLTIAGGEIVASVTSADTGRGRVKIAGKSVSKDPEITSLEVGFNPKFLISSFETATVGKDCTVKACFTDNGSPVVLTGNRANWLGVVMPKRV